MKPKADSASIQHWKSVPIPMLKEICRADYGKEPISIEFEMGIGQILADQEKWSYSTGFSRCPQVDGVVHS